MDKDDLARPPEDPAEDDGGDPGRSLSSASRGDTAFPELTPPPPMTVQGLIDTDTPTLREPGPALAVQSGVGFDLLEELGRGGMGIVYRARQNNLRRDVAIKKTRSKTEVGRFLSEALVTAFLDHPNIVPVYDLGVGPEGEAMMAMKLVGGTEWARLIHPFDAEDRERAAGYELEDHLRILISVCNAVRLAHDRGIAHLDLKPENVMVGEYGEVLVMDWGIAADIRPRDAVPEGELRTRHHSQIASPCGTPSYMAPELAQGDGPSIGAQSDVFLLGAILFELLEGRPPHRDEGVWRTIARASLGPEVTFTRPAPRELRLICQRALSLDPRRRQPGVRVFIEELQDYLKHKESREVSEQGRRLLEAAGAAPERDQAYRDLAEAAAVFRQALSLWQGNDDAREGEREARRSYARVALDNGDLGVAEAQTRGLDAEDPERALLEERLAEARRLGARQAARGRALRSLALAAFGAALIGGVLAYVRTERARIRERELSILARISADRARRNAEEARRSVERAIRSEIEALKRLDGNRKAFDVVLFGLRNRLETVADERVRRLRLELLEQAYAVLEELESEVESSGLARHRLASLQQLGEFAELAGRSDQALGHYQRAVDIGRALLDSEEGSERERRWLRQSLASALGKLGRLQHRRGRLDDALKALRSSLDIHRGLVRERPEEPRFQRGLSIGLDHLGRALVDRGELEGALETARESLEIRRALSRANPGSAARLDDLGVSYGRVGEYLFRAGRLKESLERRDDALKVYQGLVEADPTNALYLRSLAVSLAQVGQAYERLGDAKRALASEEESLELRRGLVERDPSNALYLRDVSVSLDRLGDLRRLLGESARALEHHRESLAIARRLSEQDPENAGWRRDLGLSYRKLGRDLTRLGDERGALAVLEDSLKIARELTRRDPASLRYLRDLGGALGLIGGLRFDLGDSEGALAAFEEALTRGRESARRAPDNEDVARELAGALENLGQVLQERGELGRAAAVLEEAAAMARRLVAAQPRSSERLFSLRSTLSKLGAVKQQSGALEAADAALGEALTLARRQARAGTENSALELDLTYILARLGQVRIDRGQEAEGLALLKEARDLGRSLLQRGGEDAPARRRLAWLLNTLAYRRARSGEVKEAEEAYSEAEAVILVRARRAEASVRELSIWRSALTGLAYTRSKRRRYREALDAAEKSLKAARRLNDAPLARGRFALELFTSIDTCRRLHQRLESYPRALALAKEAAALAKTDARLEGERKSAGRAVSVLQRRVREAGLIAGEVEVKDAADALFLGRHHYEQGRYREAAGYFKQGLPQEGQDKGPHLLFAARSAAMSSREDPEAWQEPGLRWLKRYRSLCLGEIAKREAALSAATEAEEALLRAEIQGLKGFLIELRDKDPLLAPLRGMKEFAAIFAED